MQISPLTPKENTPKILTNFLKHLFGMMSLFLLVFLFIKSNNEIEKILQSIKIIEIAALFFIFLESYEALSPGKSDNSINEKKLWKYAKISSSICFIVVVLLVISMFDNPVFKSLEIYINRVLLEIFLVMIPMATFTFVNYKFIKNCNKSNAVYSKALHYFYIVNIPSFVSLVTIITITIVFLLSNINHNYVLLFSSGATTFSIFISLYLSHYAETLE